MMKLIIHGPPLNPTGLGYTRGYLGEALNALGEDVYLPNIEPIRGEDGRLHAGMDPSWGESGCHIVIDQPMSVDTSLPWHYFMPFFELPPRPDEVGALRAGTIRRILCCNPDIKKWVAEINDGLEDLDFCLPMAQLGAQVLPEEQRPERQLRTVVTVGKAEPRKGTRYLFRALDRIGYKGAFMAITHPLHQQIEIDRLQDLTDQGSHVLVPFTPNHTDVQRLLASCHVAVFPACAEGWNLGLTEALAQGCIVVASDIAAHRWQRDLMVQEIGEEETARRFLLIPTSRVPMTHHQRWYPPAAYPNVMWDEVTIDDLAEGIGKALAMPIPPMWSDELPFPLSWTHAAQSLQRTLTS